MSPRPCWKGWPRPLRRRPGRPARRPRPRLWRSCGRWCWAQFRYRANCQPGTASPISSSKAPAAALALRLYRPTSGRLPQAYDPALRILHYRTGWHGAAVVCRLAPEHRCPAAPKDGLAAFRHIAALAPDHVISPDRWSPSATAPRACCQSCPGGPQPRRPGAREPALPIFDADIPGGSRLSVVVRHDGKAIRIAAITRYFRLYIADAATRLQPCASPILAPDPSGLPRRCSSPADAPPARRARLWAPGSRMPGSMPP